MPPRHLQFAHNPDASAPEDTVILLDTSPSMDTPDLEPNRLDAAKNAIRAHLEIKQQHYPKDRVALVAFNASAQIAHGLAVVGNAGKSMEHAIASLTTSPATNISAGLLAAEKLLTTPLESASRSPSTRTISRFLLRLFVEFPDQPPPRHAREPDGRCRRIILLSDGCHNTGIEPRPIAMRLKQSGILIDVIGVSGDVLAQDFDEPELKALSSQDREGNPRYCFIKDAAALAQHFRTLSHHIVRVSRRDYKGAV